MTPFFCALACLTYPWIIYSVSVRIFPRKWGCHTLGSPRPAGSRANKCGNAIYEGFSLIHNGFSDLRVFVWYRHWVRKWQSWELCVFNRTFMRTCASTAQNTRMVVVCACVPHAHGQYKIHIHTLTTSTSIVAGMHLLSICLREVLCDVGFCMCFW